MTNSTKNKPAAPATPRTIDPAIAALRAEHKAKVATLKAAQASAETLKRITEELLPKLTTEDKSQLFKELSLIASKTE